LSESNREEKIKCVAEWLGRGLTVRDIAKACGIPRSTVQHYIRLIRGETPSRTGRSKAGSTQPETAPAARGSPEGGAFRDIYRILGQEYASMLKTVMDKTGWFTEALVSIGWWSMIAAFQYARIDPKDIPRRVDQYKDAEAFIRDVTNYLTAMIQASSDAVDTITSLQREAERYKNASRVLAGIVNALKLQLRDTTRKLEVAQALLSRYGLLEEYANAVAQIAIVESIALMPLKPAEPTDHNEGGGGVE
jgi:transposase-like protein